MKEKSTGDLGLELMKQPDLDTYIKENQDVFVDQNIAALLSVLYEKRPLSKAELARRSSMSEVYVHQVFSGRRCPSRDRLICLCIGLEATLEETQRLLLQAGYGELYPKLKRESIIIHGLHHHTPVTEINDKLFQENERTLF